MKLNIFVFNEVTKTSHFQKTKKPPNYNVLVHKQSGLAQQVGPRSPSGTVAEVRPEGQITRYFLLHPGKAK